MREFSPGARFTPDGILAANTFTISKLYDRERPKS